LTLGRLKAWAASAVAEKQEVEVAWKRHATPRSGFGLIELLVLKRRSPVLPHIRNTGLVGSLQACVCVAAVANMHKPVLMLFAEGISDSPGFAVDSTSFTLNCVVQLAKLCIEPTDIGRCADESFHSTYRVVAA
jgi:hypothetical protein